MFDYVKRRQAELEYRQALIEIEGELNNLRTKHHDEEKLINATQEIIVVANAVKKQKIISNVSDTNDMAEVLRSITICLKDPEFENVETVTFYEKAFALAEKLPDKAPLALPIRMLLGALATVSSLAMAIFTKMGYEDKQEPTKKPHPSEIFKEKLKYVDVEDLTEIPSSSKPVRLGG